MQHAVEVNKEQQISIRLEPDVAERAESLVAKMTTRPEFRPFRLTRASVLRMAMLEGLEVLEQRYGDAASDARNASDEVPTSKRSGRRKAKR